MAGTRNGEQFICAKILILLNIMKGKLSREKSRCSTICFNFFNHLYNSSFDVHNNKIVVSDGLSGVSFFC